MEVITGKSIEWIAQLRRWQQLVEEMPCSELATHIAQNWGTWSGSSRQYATTIGARKGCQQVEPYALRQLEARDPYSRWCAVVALAGLRCRNHRDTLVNVHLKDPDEGVRIQAIVSLSVIFRGDHDREILRLGLAAFDNPGSSLAMRLAAAAALTYQLNVPPDLRILEWWEEDERDLQHPALLWAVAQARCLM